MEGNESRLLYIDIAKGLLVLSVLFFHLPTILSGSCSFTHPINDYISLVPQWYLPFFMPAFFVVSGYCTNFDKPFYIFIKSLVRKVLLPLITLNLLPCVLSFNYQAFNQFGNISYWLWGLSFWFLPCFLLGKLFFWVINRLSSNLIEAIIGCVVCLLLSVVFDEFHIFHNYWYWKNAFAFQCCIIFGRILRKSRYEDKILISGSIIYIVSYLIFSLSGFDIPTLGLTVSYTVSDLWKYPILVLCGSSLIMLVSKITGHCVILEYIGKGSLVFYCLHWMIAQHVGKWLISCFMPESTMAVILLYCSTFLLTIVGGILFIYFFSLPIARNFIGNNR